MADYKADRSRVSVDVAGGVIPGEFNGTINRSDEVVGRRITLHEGNSTCQRQELMIPPHATDMLRDVSSILRRYESQRLPEMRDLMILFTVRFRPGGTFHAQFEAARSFAWAKLCVERRLPVVLVQHQPGLSGYSEGKPHIHMLIFARELHDSNFLGFTPLLKGSPKVTLAAEWAAWPDRNA
ncbi:hypothetical protein [Sphingomonas astaxanthinifaciens]|uniref:Uncharacterized protein n=1 Tax=Sphingomonas astaxanthinifaciens DSM 22298 TaxID=1123267 RepID=A0ABQ5Z5R4_9SPHN|nr:hypothetical protein [Sphingomonas astaxanthinifaciens]GLR48100.1 hypothetical protein GCM10007925_18130 [Sphingomonas astaxanthinifaciens DSM 22298]